jgi:hypothetical protein
MSLRTNLSTRPFYNERAVQAVLLALAVLVAVATVYNVTQLMRLGGRDRERGRAADAAAGRARTLRQDAARIRRGLDAEHLAEVAAAVREANAVIDARTFSWTALLNHLETTLPADVRLVAIRPRLDDRGQHVVVMEVEGRAITDIEHFLDALEATGAFHDVLTPQEHETEEGLIKASVEGVYQPSGTVPAGGAR